jgi:hypothetical protein
MRGLVLLTFIAIVAGIVVLLSTRFAPSQTDRQVRAFQNCVRTYPHPALPVAAVTHDAAAKHRAFVILDYVDGCARASGILDEIRPSLRERLSRVWARPSFEERRLLLFRSCIARNAVASAADIFKRPEVELSCGLEIRGLGLQQLELASGYNPTLEQMSPIDSYVRYMGLRQRVASGTWWTDVCR